MSHNSSQTMAQLLEENYKEPTIQHQLTNEVVDFTVVDGDNDVDDEEDDDEIEISCEDISSKLGTNVSQAICDLWQDKETEYGFDEARLRIGLALFGPEGCNEQGYHSSPEISDVIRGVLQVMSGSANHETFRYKFIEIIVDLKLKDGRSTTLFVFRYLDSENRIRFTDISARYYKDWEDWVVHNTLPEGTMTYPTDGRYCNNSDGEINSTSSLTPAALPISKVIDKTDKTAAIAGIALFGYAVACWMCPLLVAEAPYVVTALSGVETTLAGYMSVRSTSQLIDRYTHGQTISMRDSEARGCWLNIGLSVVGVSATKVANKTLQMQKMGRRITQTRAVTSNVLNVSRLALSGGALVDTGYRLRTNKEERTPLALIQFSLSVYFFTRSAMDFQAIQSTAKLRSQLPKGKYFRALKSMIRTTLANSALQRQTPIDSSTLLSDIRHEVVSVHNPAEATRISPVLVTEVIASSVATGVPETTSSIAIPTATAITSDAQANDL